MSGVVDISLLSENNISDQSVTSHLASRFNQGLPFATISSGALIALNTYSALDVNQDQVFRDFAARIHNRFVKRDENQVVLFLGESGSGKTEFRRALSNHLLTLSNNGISKKVRDADFVFACFTTTRTASSLTASRAGEVIELQYAADDTLIGASFLDYRLERARITRVPTSERNYHIFYHLIAGLSRTEREHLSLSSLPEARYRYLGHHNQLNIGIDDEGCFLKFRSALNSLDFQRSDTANICQILAAILHIGQLSFKSTGFDGTASAAIEVMNPQVLSLVAQFLGVRSNLLETALSYKTVQIKNDRVTLILDSVGARENADSLSRTLYTLLFSWVLEKINTKLSRNKTLFYSEYLKDDISKTITIADFPGFNHSSSIPTIDKLLHNSANELLYSFMLKSYFESPTELFESEEVAIPSFKYYDNSAIVKTLFKPRSGVLAVIDDASRSNKQYSALLATLERKFATSDIVQVNTTARQFSINHFAGVVEYSTDNLVESNSDAISADIINLFTSSSTSEFLKKMFASSAVVDTEVSAGARSAVTKAHLSSRPMRAPSVSKRKYKQDRTAAAAQKVEEKVLAKANKQGQDKSEATSQYVAALENLVDSFDSSHPYFVICIKPNDRKFFNNFDARCVKAQIQSLGVTELALRTKVTDFSVFMPFSKFLSFVEPLEKPEDAGYSERDRARDVILKRKWTERDARYGLTGVFLSEDIWLQLTDPKMLFAFNADAAYDKETNYFQEIDGRSTFGEMFPPHATKKMNDEYISAKPMGEGGDDVAEVVVQSAERKRWLFLVWLWTWWLPDPVLRTLNKSMRDQRIRVAWREKLAINLMIWFTCIACGLFLIGFPYLICPPQNILSTGQLSGYTQDSSPNKVYTSIRGIVFDITHFAPAHYPPIVPTDDVLDYGGKISSTLFPIQVSSLCNYLDGSEIDPQIQYGSTTNYSDPNGVYHDFRYFTNDYRPDWYLEQMHYFNQNYRKSYIGITPSQIASYASKKKYTMVSLNGYVYNFTDYVSGMVSVKAPKGVSVNSKLDPNFLDSRLMEIIQQHSGQDITKAFENLHLSTSEQFQAERCLKNIFMAGKLDTRESARCKFARYFLLAITVFVVFIIFVKFVASLQFGSSRIPEDLDKFFICQVPAYTEDEESLRRAIDSVAKSNYDDRRKLLVVICDGMIVGAGNDRSTPQIVLDILGSPPDLDPPAYDFESLGEGSRRHNMGKVYTGLYEIGAHIVPYLVIVKVGTPHESSRPGNRGKRDSQILLMRFLNRVHYNLPMCPLELELYNQIQNNIGINPHYYEFVLQIDADTMIDKEAPNQLIGSLVNDRKTQAVCGETSLSNAKSTIVTMIQVYEYYISHNLAKAFENLFGSVTCLPGCFTMYRVYDSQTGKPIFVSHDIIRGYEENTVDTLHMKNLLHLGEDRYLTTLLLHWHPQYRTRYLRHAEAYTVAPDTWAVFLSQRRRWINSTVHNMFELVPASQLCGFCCFSMRFMVMVDLFSTIIQPVTVVYLVYLFYLIGDNPDNVPLTSIIMLAAIYGLQALVFILRRKWEMVGWMVFYILAIPIFSLWIPLYAYWYMDDFSWGNTRIVQGENGKETKIFADEGTFDPSEIPLQTWEDYQGLNWRSEGISQYDADSVADGRSTIARTAMTGRKSMAHSVQPTLRTLPGEQLANETGDDVEMSLLQSSQGPTREEINAAVRDILASGDLETLSKKAVRMRLEEIFGVNLNSKKEYINYVIMAVLKGEI